MNQQLKNNIRVLFNKVQFTKTCHKSMEKKLKGYYEQSNLDDFTKEFIECLMLPLAIVEKHPHVENSLIFAANFAVGFHSFSSDEEGEQMNPFLLKLFDFLMRSHNAVNQNVRFRVCYFLNMILTAMGDTAYIDDVLCDKITTNMMDRLMDKSQKVRAQAILALQRLQDPTDDECPVIKTFIFHLCKDPSCEVRRTVLMCMARTQKTLLVALKRTRDINELVRKAAYLFISKVSVRSLSIKQREELLNDGLRDRSDLVKNCVKKELIYSWLRNYNGDFIALLRALDPGMNIKGLETAVLTLKSLLETSDIKVLMEQLPIEVQSRLIPIDKLSSENVLFWRCLAEHLKKQGRNEDLEEIVPELSQFCRYIRDLLTIVSSKQLETWERTMNQFILCQLFEMVKLYDLADECGRENLRSVMLDTLMHEHCSDKIVQCIVDYLDEVIPDMDRRVSDLAEVINELRRPSKQTQSQAIPQLNEDQANEKQMLKAKLKVKLLELKEETYNAVQDKSYIKAEELNREIIKLTKEIQDIEEELTIPMVTDDVGEEKEKNDSHTMTVCLEIMCTMMQSTSVKTLIPTLRSLLDHMVLESLLHPDINIHELALKAVAICCQLDGELAKNYFTMYFLQFSLYPEETKLWLTALKAIFDLLLRYGLEFFDIAQADEACIAHDRSKRNRTVRLYTDNEECSAVTSDQFDVEEGGDKFIKVLTSLLENESQELRVIATEGLTKLLFCRRISSARLLSRLIILWHNPVSEGDTYLSQCLCSFFNSFAACVPDSQVMLEEAFLPTLRTLANAPEQSPLQIIDPHRISEIILNLTKPGIHKHSSFNVHNDLVFSILSEVLNPNSEIGPEVLIKSLKHLEVRLEIKTLKENLKDALNNVLVKTNELDRRLVRYVEQFKAKLDAAEPKETQEDDGDAESETNSVTSESNCEAIGEASSDLDR